VPIVIPPLCRKFAAVLTAAAGACSSAWSSDYYDAATNTVRLREVIVGDAVYKKVIVGFGQLLSLNQGEPQAAMSAYSTTSGVLSVPFIRVGSSQATNGSGTITQVVSVGPELRLDTRLPSGETYGAFKAAALAAWREVPRYIDPARYQAQLRQLETSTSCYGFAADDLIPASKSSLSWADDVHLNVLYPMRTTRYDIAYWPNTAFPAPFTRVNIDANVYAQSDERVAQLRNALVDRLIHLGSSSASASVREELKAQLLAHARANALSDGLLVNWSTTITPNTPVHFELLPLGLHLIHAFSHVAALYTPPERQLVGDWLNRFVGRVLSSSWAGNRQDNKAYYRSQLALAWGLIAGNSGLVRNAILMFKHALNEVRPDGSFVNESSRGGSANLYQSQAADSLLSLAVALEENLGLPALTFQIDGKSVWTVAGRVLDAQADQVRIASQYGKSCEQGSFGTVSSPDPRWGSLQQISFLRIALKRDGLGAVPARIRQIPWARHYYPEREGVDLMSVLGGD